MINKIILWILIPAVILLPTLIWHSQPDSKIMKFIYVNTPGIAVGLWYGFLIRRRTIRK
jgi:hypothetical protein